MSNTNKKESQMGIFQDYFTFLYCLIIIPHSIYNLYNNTIIFGQTINLFSYFYFISTGIINLYYLEYNFVIHHIICIGIILSGTQNNLTYNLWLSKCFLSEISNVFLSSKNILKHLKKNNIIIPNYISKINDFLFVGTYIGVRILYLIPYTIYFFYNNNDFNYLPFILMNVFTMFVLNLYWLVLIIKKIIKMFKNKNN